MAGTLVGGEDVNAYSLISNSAVMLFSVDQQAFITTVAKDHYTVIAQIG